MVHLKKVFLTLLLLYLSGVFISLKEADPKPNSTKWVVLKGGSLQVTGSTNINKFTCAITGYSKSDTLTVYRTPGQAPVTLTGSLNLDVKLFDCKNPVMTSDLRKTLKAKNFPVLKITFINLSRFPDLTEKTESIKGVVDIELAGVVKRFDVNYKFFKDQRNAIRLIGEREVNFSDFKLIPPRKLGGMIQTDNELKVQFEISMKQD